MASSFRDLVVWQKAMRLSVLVYQLSAKFPRSEMFRLTSQITGAVVGVAGNIAEGNGRGTRKDYAHFLSIAKGSLNETETYLLLALELGYATQARVDEALALAAEISKMLVTLRKRLLEG
jgi:four helix bundle protein